jgi:hypothetical protein
MVVGGWAFEFNAVNLSRADGGRRKGRKNKERRSNEVVKRQERTFSFINIIKDGHMCHAFLGLIRAQGTLQFGHTM